MVLWEVAAATMRLVDPPTSILLEDWKLKIQIQFYLEVHRKTNRKKMMIWLL